MSYSCSLSGHAFSKKFETELCFSICTIYSAIIFYLKLFEIDTCILYRFTIDNNIYIPEKIYFNLVFTSIYLCRNLCM